MKMKGKWKEKSKIYSQGWEKIQEERLNSKYRCIAGGGNMYIIKNTPVVPGDGM
jgi:hypothetical protein